MIIKGVVAQNPDAKECQQKIIDILYQKKYYEAIYEMNSYIMDNPFDSRMYFLRGYAKLMLNDYKAGKKDLRLAQLRGFTEETESIKMILNKGYLAEQLAELYLPDIKLDSASGFKPLFALKDSLRGALRPERTCFDVYYYDLTVKILPENKMIEGINRIYFVITENTSRIQIDLFSNYTIHAITHNGNDLDYKRIHNAIFIDFKKELKPGENHIITVEYSGTPREAPDPPWNGGFVWKKSKKKDWIGVACEHLGASSWWPNKDHLSDKPDSVLINLIVPDGYMGISNGNLRSIKKVDERFINYQWFVSYPINNYNVTLYIGEFVNFNETFESINGSFIIDYYVQRHNLKKAKKYYTQTKDVVAVFEDLFGEYPFKNDGMAMIEAPYAGMEHQSAIAIGDDYGKKQRRNYKNTEYDYLVVHETAHEWWGNAVAIGDMADAWINEGFATYAEHLFIEKQFGYPEYINAVAETMKMIYNVWPIVGLRDVNDNTFLGNDIYHKGAAMLHNLRCNLDNDSLFMKIIKDYYNRYKFKITCTDDFVNIVHEYTKTDYTDFFHTFLYNDEPPVLEYSFSIVNNTLSLKYKWINVGNNFNMPFCITINNDSNIRLTGSTERQTYRHEDVEHFYIPNENRFYADQIIENSFTYYRTSWIEEEYVTLNYDKKSKCSGNMCAGMEQGRWEYDYPNGEIKFIAHYLDGKLHGLLESYSQDGELNSINNYRNDTLFGDFIRYKDKNIFIEGQFNRGLRDGIWKYYHNNGKLESTGNYKNDLEDGSWKFYNANKNLVAKGEFSSGKPVLESWEYINTSGKIIKAPDTVVIVDSPPEYRYGEAKMLKFISNNITIPQELVDSGERETVYISFLVNPNGILSDFKVENSFSEEVANCIIDVVKRMPRWIPGYNKGNPVFVRFYLPYKVLV